MKCLKRLLCVILIITISSLNHCMEVNALFGNTHFNLGKIIIEQSNISLSESEKNAFLSGLVYADIGRFKFDKECGVNSDSDEFIVEMKKYAETPEEEWFIHGFEMHVFQDKETGKFLRDIFSNKGSGYLEYIMNCSLLDSYFLEKSGCYIFNDFLDKFNFEQVSSGMNMKSLSVLAGIPEDKIKDFVGTILNKYFKCPNKHPLTIYGDLIRKTYNSFGLKVSIDDIYEQAANIVGAFAIMATIAGKNKIPEDLISRIESKSNELVQLCGYESKFL